MRKVVVAILVLSLTFALPLFIRTGSAQRKALFYGPASLGTEEALWTGNGHPAPVVANASTWSSMTAQDFASYSAIVFCDPDASGDVTILDAADANKAVWSSVITGPTIVLGTDPAFHSGTGDANNLILRGLEFATSGSGTGLYACLSTYWYNAASALQVSFLSAVGNFTIIGQDSASANVTIVAPGHPAMTGLTDAGLSNWGNSVHEFILGYPVSFEPLVVADRPGESLLPYIIATAPQAVGGEILNTSALQLLAPYVSVALVAVATIGFAAKYKRKLQ